MEEVILGLPGPWAEDYREKADYCTTKIGGLPDWPVPEFHFGPELLRCRLCAGALCLLTQIYAPISMPESNHLERVLYVLGCPGMKCRGEPQTWRVLRMQKCWSDISFDVTNQSTAQLVKDSSSVMETCEKRDSLLFSEHSDGSDDEGGMDLQLLSQALAEATSCASQSKKNKKSKKSNSRSQINQLFDDPNLQVLPCFYIHCKKEHPTRKADANLSTKTSGIIEGTENDSCDCDDGEKWEGEAYEYDRAIGADRTFLKFMKFLDSHPELCFRYSYGGNPILASTEMGKPEVCKLCGSPRIFELQLMPPLLYFLSEATDESVSCLPSAWTWMSLIIYTCSKNCCPSLCADNPARYGWGVAEEVIIVQDD